jgi:hypothetical protein
VIYAVGRTTLKNIRITTAWRVLRLVQNYSSAAFSSETDTDFKNNHCSLYDCSNNSFPAVQKTIKTNVIKYYYIKIHLIEYRVQWRSRVKTVTELPVP